MRNRKSLLRECILHRFLWTVLFIFFAVIAQEWWLKALDVFLACVNSLYLGLLIAEDKNSSEKDQ